MEYEKKVEITQKKTGQRKQEEQEVRGTNKQKTNEKT